MIARLAQRFVTRRMFIVTAMVLALGLLAGNAMAHTGRCRAR